MHILENPQFVCLQYFILLSAKSNQKIGVHSVQDQENLVGDQHDQSVFEYSNICCNPLSSCVSEQWKFECIQYVRNYLQLFNTCAIHFTVNLMLNLILVQLFSMLFTQYYKSILCPFNTILLKPFWLFMTLVILFLLIMMCT